MEKLTARAYKGFINFLLFFPFIAALTYNNHLTESFGHWAGILFVIHLFPMCLAIFLSRLVTRGQIHHKPVFHLVLRIGISVSFAVLIILRFLVPYDGWFPFWIDIIINILFIITGILVMLVPYFFRLQLE